MGTNMTYKNNEGFMRYKLENIIQEVMKEDDTGASYFKGSLHRSEQNSSSMISTNEIPIYSSLLWTYRINYAQMVIFSVLLFVNEESC